VASISLCGHPGAKGDIANLTSVSPFSETSFPEYKERFASGQAIFGKGFV
jgi:hypothetical protein